MRKVWPVLLFVLLALSGCATNSEQKPEPQTTIEPEVDFTWTPEKPFVGDLVSFAPSGSKAAGTDIVEWFWDFGDGATATIATPTHAFSTPGAFEVAAKMRLSDGQTAEYEQIVPVAAKNAPSSSSSSSGTPSSTTSSSSPGLGFPVILYEPTDLGYQFSYEWGATPDSVAWDFGDGTTSRDAAPRHSFPAPQIYTVTFVAFLDGTPYQASLQLEAQSFKPTFFQANLGYDGAEPSIGITSSGCIFFQAMVDTLRSCDGGQSWTDLYELTMSPTTSDPWLWVDRATDRIFAAHQLVVGCVWVAWSDDDGDSWLGNPWDCGATPVVDHFKIGSGPWTQQGLGLLGGLSPLYPQAVYLCYNKVAGSWCTVSLDGGVTFPVSSIASTTVSGQHGAIEAGPDGTVYMPLRWSGILSGYNARVSVSYDNAVTWTVHDIGTDVGSADPINNPEVATDRDANAYITWQGADNGLYMARSTNAGADWSQSYRVTPAEIGSTVFPAMVAGDAGRVAIAYLGAATNAHGDLAPADTVWDIYVSVSLNALDENPDFFTYKLSQDPVQFGSIHFGGGSDPDRNLLDFIDISLDNDGRFYIAYADGCINACADALAPNPELSRDSEGAIAYLASGPSLYADRENLEPLI